MTTLLILYIVVGLIVYFVTDTSALARKIESSIVVINYGMAQQAVFAGVVALWPLWLLYLARSKPDS